MFHTGALFVPEIFFYKCSNRLSVHLVLIANPMKNVALIIVNLKMYELAKGNKIKHKKTREIGNVKFVFNQRFRFIFFNRARL